MWESWQDAYAEYRRYLDKSPHDEEKAFEEAVEQASHRR